MKVRILQKIGDLWVLARICYCLQFPAISLVDFEKYSVQLTSFFKITTNSKFDGKNYVSWIEFNSRKFLCKLRLGLVFSFVKNTMKCQGWSALAPLMAQRQAECVVSPKETFRWTTPFFDLQFVEIKSKKPRSRSKHHSRSRSRGNTMFRDPKLGPKSPNGMLKFDMKMTRQIDLVLHYLANECCNLTNFSMKLQFENNSSKWL